MKRWGKWSKAVIPLAITAVVASSPLQAFAYTGGEKHVETDYSAMVNHFKRIAGENVEKNSYQKVKDVEEVSDNTFVVRYKEKLTALDHRNAGATLVKSYSKLGYDVVRVNAKSNLSKTLQAYEKSNKVLSVTPSVLYKKLGTVDPKINDMYHLEQLDILKAQGLVGDDGVKVAVIDTGLDKNHPELKNRVVESVNIVDPMRKPVPDLHATHVAGIIAGEKNNGVGGTGVNPNAEILSIDVFNGDLGAYDFAIAEGIVYAVDHGAKVINMSLGGFFPSTIIEEAVNYALASDVVVVAAAGNSSTNMKEYPASYKGVISVGATNENKELASFSTYGASVDVVAPGEDIYNAAYINGESTFMNLSGTSMASPVVAGIASLLLAKNPDLTPYEIEYLLKSTAEDLGSKGYDTTFGYGLVNPLEALKADVSKIPANPIIYEEDILDQAKKLTFSQNQAVVSDTITQAYQQEFFKTTVKEGELTQIFLETPVKHDYQVDVRFYPEGEDSYIDMFTINNADIGQPEGYLFEAYMDGTLVIGVSDVNDNAGKNTTPFTLKVEKATEWKEDGNDWENPHVITNLPYETSGEAYLTGGEGDQDFYDVEVEEAQTVKAKVNGVPGLDIGLNLYMYDEVEEDWYLMEYSNRNGYSQGEALIFEGIPGGKYRVEVTSMPEYFDEFFGMWFEGVASFSSHLPYTLSIDGKVLPADEDGFPHEFWEEEEEVVDDKLSVKEYAKKHLARKSEEFEPIGEDIQEEEMEDILWEAAIPLEIGSSATGYMQYKDDIDIFKFETTSSGLYHFEIDTPEDMTAFFELYEYDELFGWWPVQANIGMMSLENYIQSGLKENKRYMLMVYNDQMQPAFEPFTISSKILQEGTNDPNESNDTEMEATILNGETITGNFDLTNDVDMFYIEPSEKEEIYGFYVDVQKRSEVKGYPDNYKMSAIDPMVYIVEDTNGNGVMDENEYDTFRAFDRGWDFEGEHGSFTKKMDAGYFIVLMNYTWEINKIPLASYDLMAGPVDKVDEDKDSVVKNNIPSKPLKMEKIQSQEWQATGYFNYNKNSEDTDWYVVPAWANSHMEVKLDVPSDINGELKLFDKNGKLLAQSSYYGYGDAEIIHGVGKAAGPYYLAVSSADGNPSLKPYQLSVNSTILPKEGNVERVSGPTRYETALAFSSKIADHSLDRVILASGKNFPDALSGVVLNQALNGTVLLINDDAAVQKKVVNEAKRLLKENGKIIILGGVNAVTASTEAHFKKHFKVERISGATRTETSIKIANEVVSKPEEVIVVSGLTFADALSIAPYAAENQIPILLNTSKTALTKEISDYLKQKSVKKVTVIGGAAAVTEEAVKQMKQAGVKEVNRVSGKNRYLTSVEIAKKFYPEASVVGVASGKTFPDALSGSHFASENSMPIVLVDGKAMTAELKEFVKKSNIKHFYLFGGEKAINGNIVK
ncbi:Thermophilic serine proteinase precursor [Bacillus sp. THAF10]|uniref:S8 family serine peptidase n=1 Tax=Bacillus sp. THAF10 TaxID=2587848 RepID=UPI0012A837BE|nr:S8 family serine peptidase [Bacillus sp. THAF10]QFT90677.1 Thermophilic serine proteinase precursor [Bacillus sp. THAF10]